MPGLEALVDDAMEGLYREASEIADEFWSHKAHENSKRGSRERSYLGVRVQHKQGTVRIEWFLTKPRTGGDGQRWTYSEYIRKGRGRHRYPEHVLAKNAEDWQIEMVRYCEDRFAEIRETAAEIVALRGSARKLREKRGLRFVGKLENEAREPETAEVAT